MSWGRIASFILRSPSFSRPAPIDMGMCLSRSECPCEARRNLSSVAPAAEISSGSNPPTGHFVRLFGLAISPFTASARIALHYKGIQPDFVEESQAGPNAWLEIDRPLRLEHGSDVVCGNLDVIIGYIEKKFGDPALVPSWKLKNKAKQWVAFVRDVFTPLVVAAWKNKDVKLDGELYRDLFVAFGKINAGIAENATSRGKFFMGSAMTMVDVYLVPVLELVDHLEFLHGIDVSGTNTNLAEYIREMRSFASYSPVAADKAALRGLACKEMSDRSKTAPAVVWTVIQHLAIARHLERLVEAAAGLRDLYDGQGIKFKLWKKPSIGKQNRAPAMVQVGVATKLKNTARDYDRLLLLMQEHAQMEETIIFPALEKAKKGVTKSANEDHATQFPIMNGVREVLKTVLVLQQGSVSHIEALSALLDKLRVLKESTAKHFLDEEKELLPSLEAAGLEARQQKLLMADGLGLMPASHSQLLPFLLSALQPHEIHLYMMLLHRFSSRDRSKAESFATILRSNAEFPGVWQIVQDRAPLPIAAASVVASA